MTKTLSDRFEIRIRFNEADPLGIVWHGHYLRYFEDGREAFGAKHGLTYLDIYKQGYVVPLVSINCEYKKSLQYGDVAVVETSFISSPAAKVIFKYKIFLERTQELVAEGSSTQVFLDKDQKMLQLTTPAFFEAWKNANNL